MNQRIFQVGEEVLRRKARTLSSDEIRSNQIQQLIGAMRETMIEAPGVGLAAPQIGLPIQLAVIEDRPEYIEGIAPDLVKELERVPVPFHVLINPKLTLIGAANRTFFEGCLSVHGFTALVNRHSQVQVECLNQQGEPVVINASGWYARILQHEMDHLNGTLYIDRMETRSLTTVGNYERYWKGKPLEEVRKALELNITAKSGS